MKIYNTKPIKVYKVSFSKNSVGREVETVAYLHDIQGLIDEQNSTFQVELYGDRVKKIINLYSNEVVDEECRIEYHDKFYRIIGIKSTTVIQPIHYIYTLEMM